MNFLNCRGKVNFLSHDMVKHSIRDVYYDNRSVDETHELSIFNPHFKGVFQTEPLSTSLYSSLTNGRFEPRVRRDVLFVEMCGLKFPNHHHFTGIFERKSKQLFEAGVIQVKMNDLLYQIFDHWFVDEPKVLDLKKLEPGFVIFIASVALATTAFVFEWLSALRDYVIVRYFFAAYYEFLF